LADGLGLHLALVPTDAEYGDMITDPCPDVDEIDVCDKYLNVFIVLIVI
jgi:hypothetical protein